MTSSRPVSIREHTAQAGEGAIDPARHLDPAVFRRLRNVTGVIGVVLSTVDGHMIYSDLDERTPGAAAAMTSSSFALGGRLGDLTGASQLEELQARTAQGYVCIYKVTQRTLLAVITTLGVNLARLKLDVRQILSGIRESGGPGGPAHRVTPSGEVTDVE